MSSNDIRVCLGVTTRNALAMQVRQLQKNGAAPREYCCESTWMMETICKSDSRQTAGMCGVHLYSEISASVLQHLGNIAREASFTRHRRGLEGTNWDIFLQLNAV